jgi:pyridoxamine 5'-phosphate oxidase
MRSVMDISKLRREYRRGWFTEDRAEDDPIHQFELWLEEALGTERPEANAMTLATADPEGRPSARVVLLKSVDERGFAFYTNYGSRKARELEANPQAAAVFYWPGNERQVRVEGRVERVTREETTNYFRTRPRGAQLGAWLSRQSEVIPGREVLEQGLAELAVAYPGEVPVPPFWGGYRLVPDVVEFWQGGPNRLHDRLRYRRAAGGGWLRERLAP